MSQAAVLLCVLGAAAPDGTVDVGRELFVRTWAPWDDRAAPGGDGLGPMYNATSCVACHSQAGVGGAGGGHLDVKLAAFEKTDEFHVEHRYSTLGPATTTRRVALRGERNTPALFGAGLIDAIPEAALHAAAAAQQSPISGRVAPLAGSGVGRFGWKGHSGSLADFVATACAAELGLSVPGRRQSEPPPGPLLEMKAQVDAALDHRLGPRADAVDMTDAEVGALTAFVRALPRPVEHPTKQSEQGRARFDALGCAGCHQRKLGDVDGLYSDLLLHDLGFGDAAAGYGTLQPASAPLAANSDFFEVEGPDVHAASPNEWRTPPLWGVRDSGPWLHDGSAETLQQAIERHRGEADTARNAWLALTQVEKLEVLAFLESLTAPDLGVASR